ncbi:MAG: type II toxin-antitoxin system VapC family toxin [Acutalibacteraceae bacterium]
MRAPGKTTQLMIMDACVLIDFLNADRTVLHLISRYVGPVYVVSPVVEELRDINDPGELIELGLSVIEPEIEDAYIAAGNITSISFQDRLCLLTAKRHGLTCVTNDTSLRRHLQGRRCPSALGVGVTPCAKYCRWYFSKYC